MTYTADKDPSDHTVDEVTAFLAESNVDTQAAVKDQEAAGKARVGILNYAPTPSQVDADPDGYTRVLVEDAYQPGKPVEVPEAD